VSKEMIVQESQRQVNLKKYLKDTEFIEMFAENYQDLEENMIVRRHLKIYILLASLKMRR
jgi:hypothetical protein